MALSGVIEKHNVDRGDTPRCTVTFYNDEEAPVDVDTCVFYVLDPAALSETAYPFDGSAPVTHIATGTYRLVFPVTRGGQWSVRCVGTLDDLTTAVRGIINVRRDPFFA